MKPGEGYLLYLLQNPFPVLHCLKTIKKAIVEQIFIKGNQEAQQ